MPAEAFSPGAALHHELQALHQQWWCFLLLGISLVVMGSICIAQPLVGSVASVMFLGFLMLAGGISQVVSSFWSGKWSGMLFHMLIGVLYCVVGYMIIDAPGVNLLILTKFIAIFLIVTGVFRIVSALVTRFHDWGWVLLNGVITLLMGLFVNRQLPGASLWVIGLFVGIEMIFNGWAWIMLAIGLRRVSGTEWHEQGARTTSPASSQPSIGTTIGGIVSLYLRGFRSTFQRQETKNTPSSDDKGRSNQSTKQPTMFADTREVVGYAEMPQINDEEPLEIDVSYELRVGIREEMLLNGRELLFRIPVDIVELEISVRAFGFTVAPQRVQALRTVPNSESYVTFFLTPLEPPGLKQIKVDFSCNRHWLGRVQMKALVNGASQHAEVT